MGRELCTWCGKVVSTDPFPYEQHIEHCANRLAQKRELALKRRELVRKKQ